MLFGEWMDRQRIRPVDIVAEAKKFGIDTSIDMVYKVRNGRRRFSPEVNRLIVKMSKGKVSWDELNFQEEFRNASGG